MKTTFARAFGMAIAIVCLLGIGAGQNTAPPEPPPSNTPPANDTPASTDTAPVITPDATPNVTPEVVSTTASETAPTLPPDILPSSPLAHVIRLVQAGISESVILTYVTNSFSTFNLDADKIIYLRDIGIPDDVVTAMMQRDQVLQGEMAAAGAPPPEQEQPVPTTTVTTDTVEVPAEQPPPEVTVNYFYNTLTPYGTWVDVAGYGRCWRPTVAVFTPGWQPYCNQGHWIYTDYGWYWVSDYSWGWETFHYGRWFRDARFGWCWYPGTVWGPAWVTWRFSDDYCGWAPLPPFANYAVGVGFTYRGAGVGLSFNFGLNADCFTFVPVRNFCDTRPWHYRVAGRERNHLFEHTRVVNDFSVRRDTLVNRGIPAQSIANLSRRPIRTFSIRDTGRRGPRAEELGRDGRTLFVHRPNFRGQPRPSLGEATPPHATQSARRMVDLGTPPRHGAVTESGNHLSPRPQPSVNRPRVENNPPQNWQPARREAQPSRQLERNVTRQPQGPRAQAVPTSPERVGSPAIRQPSPPPNNRRQLGAAIETPRTEFNPPNRTDLRPASPPPTPVNRNTPGAPIQTPRAEFNAPNRVNNRPAWSPTQPTLQTPREIGRNPERRISRPATVAPAARSFPRVENRPPAPVTRQPVTRQAPMAHPEPPRAITPRSAPPRVGSPPEHRAPVTVAPSRAQPSRAPAAPPARSQPSNSGQDRNQNGHNGRN